MREIWDFYFLHWIWLAKGVEDEWGRATESMEELDIYIYYNFWVCLCWKSIEFFWG